MLFEGNNYKQDAIESKVIVEQNDIYAGFFFKDFKNLKCSLHDMLLMNLRQPFKCLYFLLSKCSYCCFSLTSVFWNINCTVQRTLPI